MGIDGLLKFLEPLTKKQHISSFKDKTIAIDMMPWLYKACYQYAFELNQNIHTDKFLQYIYDMLYLLQYYNIKPICIFDGKYVKNKQNTIIKRKNLKQQNKVKGLQLLQQGNIQQSKKYLSKCININQKVICQTINALKTKNIQFIISPYQSDSQISKLYNLKMIDGVITEDSDLVIYGVKAILKLNAEGQCDYIDLEKWKQEDVNSIFLKQFIKMDRMQRLQLAILAGTDYNPSIKGIGMKKALKYMQLYGSMNNVIQNLSQNKQYSDKIPQNYHQIINQSKLIFLFATTYNPQTQKLQLLNQSLHQISPYNQLPLDYLQTIVGKFYNFNNDHYRGLINIKNDERRQINTIQITYKSILSPIILQQKQFQNLERRKQQQTSFKINIISCSSSNSTQKIIKKQLVYNKLCLTTQQQEQKRILKEERYNQFKKMLQAVYDLPFNEESSICSSIVAEESEAYVGQEWKQK